MVMGELGGDAAGVSKRMREALLRAKLTQAEAAQSAGIDRNVVHKAVVRGSIPREDRVRAAVAQVLGVAYEWLWYGKGAPTPKSNGHGSADAPTVLATFGLRHDPEGYLHVVTDTEESPDVQRGDILYVTPMSPVRIGDKVLVWVRGRAVFGSLVALTEQVVRLNLLELERKSVDAIHKVAAVSFI